MTARPDLDLAAAAGDADVHHDPAAMRQWPITADCKGFGPVAAHGPVTAATLAGADVHDGRLSYPLLTLRESALSHNIAAMADYCRRAGVELAPHGKTTMAPQLAARQLAAGAWGITVATPAQLQTYYRFGVRRLLLANELVDAAGTAWLAGALRTDPDLEAYCYVDSVEGVHLLERTLASAETGDLRPLPVLVELGHADGRTGARGPAAAREVAAEAAAAPHLSLAGAAGYEGGVGHHRDPDTLDRVAAYCRDLRELTADLARAGLVEGRPLVSAGGSAFFDVVVAELSRPVPDEPQPPLVVLRSGAYVTHDHGFYAGITPAGRNPTAPGQGPDELTLEPALELWAPVLSRPEPGLALLGAGRRDVSFDEGLPVPLRVHDSAGRTRSAEQMTVTALNDQHAYLRLPAQAGLGPGDLVCLGISHPCTTFDKWRAIPVVDDQDRLTDVIHTFF
jgi:D-serine deaminase-like pyridoxal phosphate-dependent protein